MISGDFATLGPTFHDRNVEWETMLDRSLVERRDRFDLPSTADLRTLTDA